MSHKEVVLKFTGGKLKFSAGHFTMFSATEREPLHGHNYTIEVALTTKTQVSDISFDYRLFENKLMEICRRLHLHCLIPTKSPYLLVEKEDPHYAITFHGETMWLLQHDVILLPIANISLEALSQWLLDELKKEMEFMTQHHVKKIQLAVFNGPAHGAEATLFF